MCSRYESYIKLFSLALSLYRLSLSSPVLLFVCLLGGFFVTGSGVPINPAFFTRIKHLEADFGISTKSWTPESWFDPTPLLRYLKRIESEAREELPNSTSVSSTNLI